MLRLYNSALLPLRAAVAAWARVPRRAAGRAEWAERTARRLPACGPGALWIHGASVGEARIVRALGSAIRARGDSPPIAVSAVTRAGRAQLPAPPEVDAAFFAPLDFPGWPARVLGGLRPAALALVETELWPNLLHEAALAGVPVAVVNGRLSTRRMARYRRWAGLYRPRLARLARIGAQSPEDAERFVELGAPRAIVTVTGSVKYDLPEPAEGAIDLRRRFGLDPARPVLVAGSTAREEEAPILDAYAACRADHPDLLLVLAPRHLDRIERVERLAAGRGHRVSRLSHLGGALGGVDAVIVDTVGDLAALYRLAWVAFVGGSLVAVGGHNVLEPAVVGVPVLFGPHTENVGEPAEALLDAGAAERVRDPRGLARAVLALLADPARRTAMGERGRRLVHANRGAMARSVALLLDLVVRPPGSAGAGS